MDLVADARALTARLTEHSRGHERDHRLSPEVVALLRDGGFLQTLLPRELGGHELAAPRYVELLEALAIGDAATAWCVMTASTSPGGDESIDASGYGKQLGIETPQTPLVLQLSWPSPQSQPQIPAAHPIGRQRLSHSASSAWTSASLFQAIALAPTPEQGLAYAGAQSHVGRPSLRSA